MILKMASLNYIKGVNYAVKNSLNRVKYKQMF